jgi:type II secretory pathway component PulM
MSAAGEWIARLRALSLREKGILLACLLFVAAFVAVRWVVSPARAEYLRNREAMPHRRATIARYETLRQGQDRVDEELFLQVQQMEKWEDGLLAGDSTSAAGVFLQGLLRPITQRPDTRVTSIRALPPVKRGPYAEVAVQMEIQTSTEGLALLLADISRQAKILQVRKLTAGTGGYHPAALQRKEVVSVSMVVAGLSAAPLDEKAASSGGRE